ncbi:prepilin-type N-terminal cleavage/methylation domain-containing protein [Planomicrobium okeanokoites]|uniref:prepilin-type N-terminal cleavage/methylation domain-containing protein n=1 Tax=Planomicrobium okeanokoites TaxID=244 RepID=UPI00248FCCFF|nr:prepilin-type N-terminal cleavage/methylation domain-containing protein [Planomicrobium okeanokoites]
MKKFLKKKLGNEKGMTLIELLAVIVILAIIAAIAIPAIGNIIENSRYSAVKADATNVLSAANLYYTENPEGPTTGTPAVATDLTVDILKTEGFIESPGKIPGGSTIIKNTTTNSLELDTSAIDFSGGKTVTFVDVSIKGINDDSTKGSDVTTNQNIAD